MKNTATTKISRSCRTLARHDARPSAAVPLHCSRAEDWEGESGQEVAPLPHELDGPGGDVVVAFDQDGAVSRPAADDAARAAAAAGVKCRSAAQWGLVVHRSSFVRRPSRSHGLRPWPSWGPGC